MQVHFKGWGKSADEWIGTTAGSADADRLAPHRLHTCGTDFKAAVRELKVN